MTSPRRMSDEIGQTRWESVVDKAIADAQRRGEFDDLPGAGKPLNLEDNPFAGDWAMAFSALKSAGVAPEWIEQGKQVRDELAAMKEERERTGRYLPEQMAARTVHGGVGRMSEVAGEEPRRGRWRWWPIRRAGARGQAPGPAPTENVVAGLEAERLRARGRYLERAARLDERIRLYNAALPNDLWRLHRGRVTPDDAAREFDAACPPVTAHLGDETARRG